MNYYQTLIIEATGCPETDAQEVENYMRDTIFHSTLDWQSKAQLNKGARQAWTDIQYMRSPEGIAYMKELEEKYT
jgi:hypothetical protein